MLVMKELSILEKTATAEITRTGLSFSGFGTFPMQTKTSTGSYPTFSEFTKFIAKEAEFDCDPVTSLGSLKSSITEKAAKDPNPRKRTLEGLPQNLSISVFMVAGWVFAIILLA
jgi:hypothetical protein